MERIGTHVWRGRSGMRYPFSRYRAQDGGWREASGCYILVAGAHAQHRAVAVLWTGNVGAHLTGDAIRAIMEQHEVDEVHVDWHALGRSGREKEADDLRRRHHALVRLQ